MRVISRFPVITACLLSLVAIVVSPGLAQAGTLTGSIRSIPRDSVVDLSTNGTLDWVHWGLYTETSINRKAGVVPQISDFALLDSTNGFAFVYQYADNYNGYTWTDGDPIAGVTNTTTGVWAYGLPFIGTGFQFAVPAGTSVRTLKVYCGVFGGTGRFEASLSDGSAPEFIETFSNIPGNGSSREVKLNYASDSPNQSLIIRWRLATGASSSPNVTLQAATLSAEGVNNPPVARITNPISDANFADPTTVSITATASDLDGSVARVEFFANGTKVGEDASSPYTAEWNNPVPGRYALTATVTDNGGESTISAPVNITIHTSGGTLAGTKALPPQLVNLTAEGTADWQHWGLSSSNLYNRKAGVSPVIGSLALIGTNVLNAYSDNYTAFTWSDGTPTPSTGPVNHGVFVYGLTNGFTFTVPADTTPRTLRVYAGLYGAEGHFQAWLSDFSAPTYHDHSLSNFFGSDYGLFTLDYAAGSAGHSLVVRYIAERLFDGDFGNVTLQAATLSGGGTVLVPVQILDPIFTPPSVRFSFQTQTGRTYEAQWLDNLGLGDWQPFVTVQGTGGLLTVTNQDVTGERRFYRVETR